MIRNYEMATSEIGTGSPPAPNKNHADISGDKDNRGIRRETPAIINPNASTVTGAPK